MFPILCSHASRAAPLRRCCLPCGMAFPRRNNKKCPSPPFQETETLKLLPSDSCSPCAKHFLTATNLGLSSIFYRTAPEKSIFFCRTSQFFCRRLRCCICLQQGEFRAPERGSLLAAVICRLFSSMPPAAPFLPAAEEMGERTPPKTHGLWNSFRPISMWWEKVPQGIDREPTLAAADMVGGGYWRDYRFRRLSNRALAAVSGKCRCGLMGRHFTLVEQSAAVRDVGAAAI